MAAVTQFTLGIVVGVFIMPVGHRLRDWYDETVLEWWYNRKRS